MSLVFDAGALVAYINNEPGAQLVENLLINNPGNCFIHAVNLCEIYYPYLRTQGFDAAQQVVNGLLGIGLQVRPDMDAAFWQSAAGYKAAYHMSLADAFCVALATYMDAELITSDRHELEPLLDDGLARITFIR